MKNVKYAGKRQLYALTAFKLLSLSLFVHSLMTKSNLFCVLYTMYTFNRIEYFNHMVFYIATKHAERTFYLCVRIFIFALFTMNVCKRNSTNSAVLGKQVVDIGELISCMANAT